LPLLTQWRHTYRVTRVLARTLRLICERIAVRRRTYCIYVATPEQPAHIGDERIEVFEHDRPPPADVRRLLGRYMGRLGAGLMLRRLRRVGGLLLIIVEGGDLLAYGWIQEWRAVRREFGWLADDGLCLGPYWTHPSARGQGVYRRMLARSLLECHRRYDKGLYIWARQSNAASLAGIEKAGFRPLGTYHVATYAFGLVRAHKRVTRDT